MGVDVDLDDAEAVAQRDRRERLTHVVAQVAVRARQQRQL